jgi:hypothetical protein
MSPEHLDSRAGWGPTDQAEHPVGFDESRSFYNDVIGLDGGEGLDWILFFGTDQREVQLSAGSSSGIPMARSSM